MTFFVYLCMEMKLMMNPIVWLLRVRHRNGYGVHSPFAFDFVTNVLYNGEHYYAYKEMDSVLRWWQKGREKKLRRLIFRLANYRRPGTLCCSGVDEETEEALHRGCVGATVMKKIWEESPGKADMIVMGGEDDSALFYLGEGSMVVLWNLREQRKLWQRLQEDRRVTVTFDLYDVGVAFARKDLNRQNYIINW